jgi:two-component system OmpR family response regulator
MKILVIEDNKDIATYIAKGLTEQGHVVDRALNGRDGLLLAASDTYDILVVDRMLPVVDGLTIVKTIRGAGVKAPVLFLTTIDGIDDRVEALEAGGDDYLVKPFAFAELGARVNALRRRPALSGGTVLRVGDLQMDLSRRTVGRGDRLIELQPREFRLLEYLMRHPGQVVTRTMLLERVWDLHFDPHTTVVETHISRLRSKLDQKDSEATLIETVRGVGWRLREAPSWADLV